MAIVHDATTKAARMQATADTYDAGAGAATLELLDASANVLAIFQLVEPCGTVSGDTLTFDFDPDITAVGTAAAGVGTDATAARIKDGGGTIRTTGFTVGVTGSGSHIELDNVSIAEGQSVTLTAGTLTHA